MSLLESAIPNSTITKVILVQLNRFYHGDRHRFIRFGLILAFSSVLLGSYHGLGWYATEHAADTIYQFYNFINKQGGSPDTLQAAWNLLSPEAQKTFCGDGTNACFLGGYKRTYHRDVKVFCNGPESNALSKLLSTTMTCDVHFVSHDTFIEKDFNDPYLKPAVVWMILANPSSRDVLEKGHLPSGLTRMEMDRICRRTFTLIYQDHKWEIRSVIQTENGVIVNHQ